MRILPESLCQIEIQVQDLKSSIQFYEHVFGWKPSPADLHEVTILEVGDECPFGISLLSGESQNHHTGHSIVLYLRTDNPEEIVKLAQEYGGRIHFGPKRLHGYGTIYQIEDPNGVRWGLFQGQPQNP